MQNALCRKKRCEKKSMPKIRSDHQKKKPNGVKTRTTVEKKKSWRQKNQKKKDMSFLFPKVSKCKTFSETGEDGEEILTVQSPSRFCNLYVGLLVVGCMLQILAMSKKMVGLTEGVSLLIVQLLLAFIMYRHCSVCDGWMGFVKIVLIHIILSVVMAIAFKNNSVAAPS